MKYSIVKLDQLDLPHVEAHLKRLDKDDRYLRFFAVLNDTAIEKHVKAISDNNSVCFGAFEDGVLVGHAQLAGFEQRNEKRSAEFAISIDKDRRGSGLARQLMQRCVNFCKADGVEVLFMSCLRENKKMQALAKAEGLKVITDHDEAMAELDLHDAPFSRTRAIQKEIAYAQISIFDKCHRFNKQIIKALLTGTR
jgi:RimJ/RimL family protein N-acetyltransferase